jgi:hypothetical protein
MNIELLRPGYLLVELILIAIFWITVDLILSVDNQAKARLWVGFIILLFTGNFVILAAQRLKRQRQNSRVKRDISNS